MALYGEWSLVKERRENIVNTLNTCIQEPPPLENYSNDIGFRFMELKSYLRNTQVVTRLRAVIQFQDLN